MMRTVIGLDYGTESARAVLVDIEDGKMIASSVHVYGDGVIDEVLPGSVVTLGIHWALQNPKDWLIAAENTIKAILKESGVPASSVIGLGIDFTACTVLPTLEDGDPLCFTDAYRDRPHAWPKLWKHHAAQKQADRINALAAEKGLKWLPRYGGKISSEWVMPKALQIAEEDPDIYRAAKRFVEGADWMVWQLTGSLVRNACGAGYKAAWHKVDGFPDSEFLQECLPLLGNLYDEKMAGPIQPPGTLAGSLNDAWAGRLGLITGLPVATPIIDAHSAALGGGVGQPGVMFMIMGTSTCHMLMATDEVLVEGISGVVEDGIVPGLFGYEAGQAGVGDIFAWLRDHAVPPEYHEEAKTVGLSLFELLAEKASALKPGENGLLALDWWNGNRSTLVNADLSGLLLGCTLGTRAEDVYRALIESTAFGTRVIIDAFTDQGVPVESIVAGGGLAQSPLIMQIYADITGRQIAVAGEQQVSALGAAMLGAVAAGPDRSGFRTLSEAVAVMAPPPSSIYTPTQENRRPYDTIFGEYRRLYDYFGRENRVMERLGAFRHKDH